MEERGDRAAPGGGNHRAAKRLRTEQDTGVRELEDGEEEEEDPAGSGGDTESRRRRSGGKDDVEDSHRIPPSPVVHVRGLCDAVVEADLVEALNKFGNICYVMMMPFKHQALVEFDSVESAERCVACGTREAVYIAEQQAFFNFSTSQRITRPTNADDPTSGNKVLLLSIQNPLYPITTDVLYTVCNPVGNVLRIVIFKRNGIQAMVEFESVEDAQKAKLALNGADIYAGCCTLKIEYARSGGRDGNVRPSWENIRPMATVKFMKSVPGTALVEMGDEYAVDRAVTHLNSIKVFGKKVNVCVSKQQAVIPSQTFELADGSSSYQDFSLTRNNRFSSAQNGRNIIQPPAAVLHFYNAPPSLSQQQLHTLCTEHDVPIFTKFKVFDAKPNSKTLSGLLEFDSKTEAMEALTVLNHHQIRIPNISNPFTLKLCFSTSSHL
ncbi:heterogeneous nuclear ribonucleoprotein L-like isoform X2 [Amphiprion ocellaris]|uniref:heterogeneous nuclear ribonucleoprotein L-like isoform X2 n=1 Tax=Amphiprion ocellaris TaxID=80972 RepID=UPI00241195F0|nr:heterogeneous nuclear ribonucleoprotein L-like isoform X2 [Amphiprion ocellaris]